MALARGAIKIGFTFAVTYLIVWQNWDKLASYVNNKHMEKLDALRAQKELIKEKQELAKAH